MKYLSFSLLILLFFSIKINAQENTEPIIEDSRLFKIHLNNSIIEYGEGEEPWIPEPEEIPDSDGDGIRDEEDPDHPSNDEDNYASWRVFLNTFCSKNFSNDQDMYDSLKPTPIGCQNASCGAENIECKEFSKMPTEDLQTTSLGTWLLNGDSRFNKITGLSQVTNFESLDVSAYSQNNSNMSQSIDLSNLSGKTFKYLNFSGITSNNLNGVTVTKYLTLIFSYIKNINSTMIEGCCTQLRASRVDNYIINSTGKLSGLYVMHGSHLGNLTMTGSKEIELVVFESGWNNGDWGDYSTLNNTSALSGLIIDYISISGNTDTPMDLSGLSASLNRNRIERLWITSKDFDFSVLNNVNSIGQFSVYSTSIDFRDLQHISIIEEGVVDTYSDTDWDIIPEGEYETFIKNINIVAKAPMSSNFCQGLQNGNLNLSFQYRGKKFNVPISEMCE